MSQVYSTSQASEVTGIPSGTIRSWLSRHQEIFLLGVHLIKDEHGRNLWTDAGIELLRQRAANNATETATPNDAFFDAGTDAISQEYLNLAADVRAKYILRELPMRTLQRLRELISDSPEVRESLQSTIYQLTQYQLAEGRFLDAAATED